MTNAEREKKQMYRKYELQGKRNECWIVLKQSEDITELYELWANLEVNGRYEDFKINEIDNE